VTAPSQRWWRTLPDELTVAQAQASLDAFCARRRRRPRVRKRDGQRTTVGELAQAEPLAPLPPAFPATVTVKRVVSSQALVAFRGNRYSVPPGLAGATVTVSRCGHRRHRCRSWLSAIMQTPSADRSSYTRT
jgi:hypothetical protein